MSIYNIEQNKLKTMKNLLLVLLFLFGFSLYSQESRTLKQIDDNLYLFSHATSSMLHTGYYKKNAEGVYVETGDWKIKDLTSNKLLSRGIYKNGELIKMIVWDNGNKVVLSHKDMLIYRLQSKVKRLERNLVQ